MFGRYDTPGEGVNKNAPKKRDFFLFFELYGRKFWNYCMIGLLYTFSIILFLIGSYFLYYITEGTIPGLIIQPTLLGTCIFTPGFVYVLRNYSWEKHSWYVRDYFSNVWKNLKQSLALYLIDAVIVFVLVTAIYTYFNWNMMLFVGFCTMLVLFVVCVHMYIYVIMVTFNMSIFAIIKNAVMLAIAKLPVNIFLLIGVFVSYEVSLIFISFAYAIVSMITIPFTGLMITFYPARVIKQLMIKEEDKVKAETLFDDNSEEVKVRRSLR